MKKILTSIFILTISIFMFSCESSGSKTDDDPKVVPIVDPGNDPTNVGDYTLPTGNFTLASEISPTGSLNFTFSNELEKALALADSLKNQSYIFRLKYSMDSESGKLCSYVYNDEESIYFKQEAAEDGDTYSEECYLIIEDNKITKGIYLEDGYGYEEEIPSEYQIDLTNSIGDIYSLLFMNSSIDDIPRKDVLNANNYVKVSNHKYALKNEYVESAKKFIVGSFGLEEVANFASCSSFVVEIKDACVHEYFEATAVNPSGERMKLMAEFLYFNVGTTKNTLPEIKEEEINFSMNGVKDLLEKNYYTTAATQGSTIAGIEIPTIVVGTKGNITITIYIDASEKFISNIEKSLGEGNHIIKHSNIVYVSNVEEPFEMFTNKNYQEEYTSEELLNIFDDFNNSYNYIYEILINDQPYMTFSQSNNSYECVLDLYDSVEFIKFNEECLVNYTTDDYTLKVYDSTSEVYKHYMEYDFSKSLIKLNLPLTAKVEKKGNDIILKDVLISDVFEKGDFIPKEIFSGAKLSGNIVIRKTSELLILTFEIVQDSTHKNVQILISPSEQLDNAFETYYFTYFDTMAAYLAHYGYNPEYSYVDGIGDFTIIEFESDNGKIQFTDATILHDESSVFIEQGFEQHGFLLFKLLDGSDGSILEFFDFVEE